MPSPGSRIRGVRKILKLSQKELADSLGTGYSNISRIERDEYAIGKAYLELLREKFNVNPDWILNGEEPIFIPQEVHPENILPQRVPIISRIPEGSWEDWIRGYKAWYVREYIEYPNMPGRDLFAVGVKDNSMEPRLHEDDMLIIDPHQKFDSGIAVVQHRGRYYVRVVRELDNMYLLVPFDPAYKEEIIVPDDYTRLYVPVKVISMRDI